MRQGSSGPFAVVSYPGGLGGGFQTGYIPNPEECAGEYLNGSCQVQGESRIRHTYIILSPVTSRYQRTSDGSTPGQEGRTKVFVTLRRKKK